MTLDDAANERISVHCQPSNISDDVKDNDDEGDGDKEFDRSGSERVNGSSQDEHGLSALTCTQQRLKGFTPVDHLTRRRKKSDSSTGGRPNKWVNTVALP
jgi:hypothetical protein